MVLDPNKPTVSPLDAFNVFVSQQFPNPAAPVKKDKPATDEKDKSDEDGGQDDQSQGEESQEQVPSSDEGHSDESDQEEDDYVYDYYATPGDPEMEPSVRNKKRKKQEKLAGVKYSDYRLRF